MTLAKLPVPLLLTFLFFMRSLSLTNSTSLEKNLVEPLGTWRSVEVSWDLISAGRDVRKFRGTLHL